METINNNFNHSINDVVKEIKLLIEKGKENETVKKIALSSQAIENPLEQQKFIFDLVYNIAVFKPSPQDRQQLRTVENILRTQTANCTGYTTFIASILENLKIPYKLRLVDTDGNGFSHIYIVTNNSVMDCILGQKQDGTQTFENRPNGMFNFESDYKKKKDYTMITTLNGTKGRIRNKNLNGIYDSIFGLILGDECELECNMKYAGDEVMRKKCKEACAMNMTMSQYEVWLAGGGITGSVPYIANPNQMSETTKYMIFGVIGLGAVYLFTRKK